MVRQFVGGLDYITCRREGKIRVVRARVCMSWDGEISDKKATMGAFLTMEPRTERFTGNDKANQLLTRDYRKPFVVPEKV